jgi:hypothetical protein
MSEIIVMTDEDVQKLHDLTRKRAGQMAEKLYAEDPTPDVVFSKVCRLRPADVVCDELVRILLSKKEELGISDNVVFSEFKNSIAQRNLAIFNAMFRNEHVLRVTKEKATQELKSYLNDIYKSNLV